MRGLRLRHSVRRRFSAVSQSQHHAIPARTFDSPSYDNCLASPLRRFLMFRSVRPAFRAAALLSAFTVSAFAQQADKMDMASLGKIRDEGMNRSKVMEITS